MVRLVVCSPFIVSTATCLLLLMAAYWLLADVLSAITGVLDAIRATRRCLLLGQGELVQPVREGDAAQADVQLVGHGEVRQA